MIVRWRRRNLLRPIVEFPVAYFITTVTKDRRRLFCDVRLAQRFATMIRLASRMKGYFLLGYGILPDHVHLLVLREGILERMPSVQGREELEPNAKGTLSRVPGSVGNLMRSVKGTFSRTMLQGNIWQRRYHLRHVTNSESLINVINYIQYNYRKHGLPELYGQEPYMWLNKSILERML